MLEWPVEVDELTVVARPIDNGDRWFESEYYWYRLHITPRLQFFTPTPLEGGIDPSCLKDRRVTLMALLAGSEELTHDSWRSEHHEMVDSPTWTGVTAFPR